MAMSKKERAEYDAAVLNARVNRALRWSDHPTPTPDVPVPERGHTTGYLFNSYERGRVEQAWSEPTCHGYDAYDVKRRQLAIGGTRDGRPLFSKKSAALRAMRAEMEMRFARTLTLVDLQIEQAIAEEEAES